MTYAELQLPFHETLDGLMQCYAYSLGALSRRDTSPSNQRCDETIARRLMLLDCDMRALVTLAARHQAEFDELRTAVRRIIPDSERDRLAGELAEAQREIERLTKIVEADERRMLDL